MTLDKIDKAMVLWAIVAALLVRCMPVQAIEHTSVDIRYLPEGVEIARNADGSIKRSTIPLDDFAKIHPCPSTGLPVRSCSGWSLDHVIPLACRGRDAVENLQWLPIWLKSFKDLFERYIYPINGFSSSGCRQKIII